MRPGTVKALRVALLLALLPASLVTEMTSLLAQDATAPASATIKVATGVDWTATSVVVAEGDQVRIQASGSSPMGPSVPDGTPAGNTSCTPTAQFVAPALPCYALIGRIDQTAPFLVGDGVTFNVKLPGELFLGVNDDFFADNQGTWDVTIQVTPAAERQAIQATPTPAPAEPTVTPDIVGTPVAVSPLEGGQQATLLQGSCREPIAVAAPVGTAQVPVGTFRGQAGAIPVASVTTILPFSFDTLLTGDYAVAVTAPATAQSRVLVCGDLGGIARLSPPETSVGLSPEEDSGWAGIAYLTPSSGEPASTVLTIFISPVLADAPAG